VRPVRYLVAFAALASPLQAMAQAADETVRFIACPIYRDTDAGRKSGCWLADERETGRRFDVSNAPSKPDWNHEVLVEGRIAMAEPGQPDACGGVVLAPVRVSILPGDCTRQMLPAEGFKGRAYVLPPRNVRPVSEPRAKVERPFVEKTFSLLFDFNRTFIVYQLDDYLLDQAITYIRGVRPKSIIITGYAATTPATVSGRSIAETPDLAQRRAEEITEALVRLGVAPSIIQTKWKTAAQPSGAPGADGLTEPSRRRVDIHVIP
jgi:outer membrane protein OmpA-like peptidoglycan-associated protein